MSAIPLMIYPKGCVHKIRHERVDNLVEIFIVIAVLVILYICISWYQGSKDEAVGRKDMMVDYAEAKNGLAMLCNKMLRYGVPHLEVIELVDKAADAALLADALQVGAEEDKYVPLVATYDGVDITIQPEWSDLEGHA